MCRHPVEHSLNADVFIDIRPVYPLPIADKLEPRSLFSRRFRQPPRPYERHTYNSSVHQVGDDGVGCNPHVLNPGLSALHNAHAMPPLWCRGEVQSDAE